MVKLAQDREISKMTVSTAMRQDLHMKSCMRKHCNILTICSQTIQAERSPRLLCHLKHGSGDVRIFVDEKKFMVDEVANRQNSRVMAYGPFQAPSARHSKNLASIMVVGAVTRDGKLMPPRFIEAGLKNQHSRVPQILRRFVALD
ncbi:Hypothetical predicted protein [Octopus vulgaris]|uniref:Uncharacterized protein n=1 Tax=Octopus vulgaris TaxID=6645 RepID=A0AA36AMU7_OCTVU|nr:Hypothetical predicted protein [Octopus vulgaris]